MGNHVTITSGSGHVYSESNPLPVTDISNLVPNNYDSISLTYVTTGNGIGEIETVTYELSSSTVATLTLSYDVNNKLSTVTKV